MAAHRYWRTLVLENYGNGSVAIDEIDLRVNSGGSRLSITGNGTASASSTQSGGYTAAGAFNGVAHSVDPSANAWFSSSSFPLPASITWDFGAGNEQDIGYVAITNVNVSGNASVSSVKRAVLAWSDDGVLWHHHIAIQNHPNTTGGSAAYLYAADDFKASELVIAAIGDGGNPVGVTLVVPEALVIDQEHGGNGDISGTVKIDGDPTDVPVRRQVLLLREPGAYAVRETWSHPTTGAYSFTGLNRNYKYTVLAYDYSHSYRAVLADNVTPDLMT